MNTTKIVPAAQTARDRASQIWADLEEWNRAAPLSDLDFYAVWGLCNAVLNTPNRDDAARERWIEQAEALWADVRARSVNAWN